MVDPPASLCVVDVCSSAGRGMADAGLLEKFGTVPRVWPRLGVPRIVPGLLDIVFMPVWKSCGVIVCCLTTKLGILIAAS